MKGLVISDLHIFSERSYVQELSEVMLNQIKNADFLVLNGDIFDFEWTTLASIDQTMHKAVGWLQNLSDQHPDCSIYYILGNHDNIESFTRLIREMSHKQQNLSVCDTHLVLGNNLFFHGDLPLAKKNPWTRQLKKNISRKRSLLHLGYACAVKCGLHKIVYSFFSPSYCAKRIGKVLQKYPQDFLQQIEHIYFGHTHLPFIDYFHQNFTLHNTGAAIEGVPVNLLEVQYDSR